MSRLTDCASTENEEIAKSASTTTSKNVRPVERRGQLDNLDVKHSHGVRFNHPCMSFARLSLTKSKTRPHLRIPSRSKHDCLRVPSRASKTARRNPRLEMGERAQSLLSCLEHQIQSVPHSSPPDGPAFESIKLLTNCINRLPRAGAVFSGVLLSTCTGGKLRKEM